MTEEDHTSNHMLILPGKQNHWHHAGEIMPSIDQYEETFLPTHDKIKMRAIENYLPVKQQHHASAP